MGFSKCLCSNSKYVLASKLMRLVNELTNRVEPFCLNFITKIVVILDCVSHKEDLL
jgi:hypothetical protein